MGFHPSRKKERSRFLDDAAQGGALVYTFLAHHPRQHRMGKRDMRDGACELPELPPYLSNEF